MPLATSTSSPSAQKTYFNRLRRLLSHSEEILRSEVDAMLSGVLKQSLLMLGRHARAPLAHSADRNNAHGSQVVQTAKR